MYNCTYEWPKKSGQSEKKKFNSATEAVKFMTYGDRDRTDFIIMNCIISIYNGQLGEYELISYAKLINYCIEELESKSNVASQSPEEFIESI